MAWKSIWLQIENKPLWGRQSGPTSYYLDVPCSIQQHGRCVPGGHARCVQQQRSTYGKEWVRGSWLGVCPHLLPAIQLLSCTQLPGARVMSQAYATERQHNQTLPSASIEQDWAGRVKYNSLEQWRKESARSPFINTHHIYPLPFFLFIFFLGNQKYTGKCNLPPFSMGRAHQMLLDWSGGCVKGLSLIIGCVPRLASICS